MSHLTFTLGEVQSPHGSLDPWWIPSSAAGGALGCKLGIWGIGHFKFQNFKAYRYVRHSKFQPFELVAEPVLEPSYVQVRTLRRGCLWWVAPPCSTWVYLARGSTGRTFTRARGVNEPYECIALSVFIIAESFF